jgi:NTP pyrophosphatase (non-canonical NTP hydrolase)
MNFNDYQTKAFTTALPTTKSMEYMLLGLTNEAGEAAGKYKKVLRGDTNLGQVKSVLADELGDVLWYLSATAELLGIPLDDIAQRNLDKLFDRKERGVLQGCGDTR